MRKIWKYYPGDLVQLESGEVYGISIRRQISEDQGGTVAPFMLDVGISSTYHIAKFWGLTEPGTEASAAEDRQPCRTLPPGSAAGGGSTSPDPGGSKVAGDPDGRERAADNSPSGNRLPSPNGDADPWWRRVLGFDRA